MKKNPPERLRSNSPDWLVPLTSGMVAGENAAYREFFDRFYDRLARYLFVAASGHEERMRDALQETFWRVVRHIRKFENEDAFWSWLTVVAKTALRDQVRKSRRYSAFLERFGAWLGHHGNETSVWPSEASVDELLDRALSRLAVEDQEILRWKYLDSATVREVAERLGCSEKAVESRLVRARERMRIELKSLLNDEARE